MMQLASKIHLSKRLSPYDLPLGIFLISAVVGVLPAYDRSLSFPTLAALLGGVLLYFLLSRFLTNTRRWDAAALSLAFVTILLSVSFVTRLGYMEVSDKIEPLGKLAVWIARIAPDPALWQVPGNTLGTLLEGTIFMVAGMLLVQQRRLTRVLLWIGLGFAAAAVLLSASHGAWLAVAAAGLLWAALHWKAFRWLAAAGAVGLSVVGLYILAGGDLHSLADVPLLGKVLGPLFIRPDRLEVYHGSLALIGDVPFTGIGLGGQFAMAYSRYGLLLHVPFLYYAHNLFLEIWLEQGLLGITAWIWLVAAVAVSACQFRKWDKSTIRIRFESTWIGLTVILIHGLSDARQAQDPYAWLPFFSLLGMNAALVINRSDLQEARNRWVQSLPVGGAAVFLLAALAFAWPLRVSNLNNQAALIEQRAELGQGLSQAQRDALLEQAAGLFQKSLGIEPGNRTANQRLGLIALSRHEFEQAVGYLSAASAADTDHTGIRKALGLAYAFTGETENALPLLHGQLNIVQELNYWGGYFRSNGLPEAGLNALKVSLALQPDQPAVQSTIDQAN
jgi:O-antigen ligase